MELYIDCTEEEWDDVVKAVGAMADHHSRYRNRAQEYPSETVKSDVTARKHEGMRLYYGELQQKLIDAHQ